MAKDVITRFKLETTGFDSKIKQAAKGLSDYSKTATQAKEGFNQFTKANVDAAKALGTTATSTTTAKDRVKELVGAYNEAAKAYNQLTREQQQSDFAKALAGSLTQLQQRISETKQEMQGLGDGMKGGCGILGVLKDKFTINIDALKLFNAGVTAAKAALDVAKDAFMASEASVDEWGRIMDSSKSLYEGFLNSINNGDISGFLGRIDQIVSSARQAYDELDRLGTMKTIQAPQISAQTTENDRMRMMIQTRRYIAPVDGRRSAMQNGQLLTPAQIKRLEQQLQNGLQKVTSLVGNEVKQTSRAIDAVYRRQGAELGMSVKEFRNGTSSMAEFDKRIEGAANYQKWQREHSYVDQQSGRLIAPRTGNPYQQYKGWDVFRVDGERYNKLVQLIQQRDQQSAQAYSTQSQAYRTINRAEGISARGTSTTPKTTNKNTGAHTTIEKTEMQINSEQIQKLTQEYIAASAERRAAIQEEIKGLQERNREIQNLMNEAQGKTSPTQKLTQQNIADINKSKSGSILGDDFMKVTSVDYKAPIEAMNIVLKEFIALRDKATTPEEWQRLNKAINGVQKGMDDFTGKGGNNGGRKDTRAVAKEIQDIADKTGKIGGSLSSIAGGIEQMGIEIPDEINKGLSLLQGVTSILTGISTLLLAISATEKVQTVTDLIPIFANGGAIRAASGFRVPGNTYSMDQVPAMLNSGEVVLNRAQAGNIASQLNDGNTRGGYQPSHISGEQIYLAMNRYLMRTGRGEIVTWK